MGSWGYVAYVVGSVPPRALAGALVRRANRNVSRALARLQAPPTDVELYAAFGARHPGDLAQKLGGPRLRAHWSDAGRAEELRALAGRLPGFAERALARAERAVQNRFDVFGREVCFADGGVRWLEDPVTQHVFPGPGAPAELPVGQRGDPKRVWALSRMDWAVALAQGAWLHPQRADRYVARLTELADALMVAAPVGEGVHAAATMEVSLRAMNLALALSMLRGHPALDGRFLLRALKYLTTSARYTLANLEDAGAVPNNHLVGDFVGLLHLALLFPELPGAGSWRTAALAGLKRTFVHQVMADGMGFEASTGYHRLLLELGLAATFAVRGAGAGLGAEFEPALQRMMLATRAYLHADGTAPNVGDHDSGRALPLTDRAPLDHGYLPALGAVMFRDARLKAPDAAFPDEAAWLLGAQAFDDWKRLPSSGGAGSVAFPAFGLAVLRRGATTVALSAGPTGQDGIGGHGHNDKLGIEVAHRGRPIVVDGGTASYAGAARDRFRGTAMHSTVQIDGEEQSPIPASRPFALPDLANAELLRVHHTAERDVAAAQHRGYARLADPVHHRREVTLDAAADAVLVIDDLSGAGTHQATSRFHLPDLDARVRPLTVAERARLTKLFVACDWELEQAIELGPQGAPTAVWVGARGTKVSLVESAYSPAYDVCVPATCIEVSLARQLPVRLAAVLLLL